MEQENAKMGFRIIIIKYCVSWPTFSGQARPGSLLLLQLFCKLNMLVFPKDNGTAGINVKNIPGGSARKVVVVDMCVCC